MHLRNTEFVQFGILRDQCADGTRTPHRRIEGQRGCYYGYIIASADKSRQCEACVTNHAPEGSCTPMPSAFRFARYHVRGCLLPILGAMVQVEEVAVHGAANR